MPTAVDSAGPAAQGPNLDDVWRSAAKYMRVRKNDIHLPLSFDFAEQLLTECTGANGLVVRLAILLHDIGWYCVDEEDILTRGFGENWQTADIRYVHEREGCRLAREILGGLGYTEEIITRVTAIIEGHDTRPYARSHEDELVRDADKLWRFTTAGIAIASGWFHKTPSQYVDDVLSMTFRQLHTDVARRIATRELKQSRRLLRIGVL
ncbi:HD domain-containing protein [Streptomyces sp. NPDC001292]|uniref:HD domain-containing protein n=1 Tax=Streptomyces sp. NPDC001292 TaxID=3364558 RepID=UPI00369BAB07